MINIFNVCEYLLMDSSISLLNDRSKYKTHDKMTHEKINVMLKYLRFTQICIVQDITPDHYVGVNITCFCILMSTIVFKIVNINKLIKTYVYSV